MNKNFAKVIFGAVVGLMTLQGCNDDSNSSYGTVDTTIYTGDQYSSTAITAFNIKPNSKVLASLDSVFFTIDLLEARIFNADSLPYGTDVSKLVISISSETISKITVNYTNPQTGEEVVSESTSSPTDSINFNNPVHIKILSANELYERTYDVKVNVHKVKTDSLCWGSMEYAKLPGLTDATVQKTVKLADKVYCMTANASNISMAATSNPADVNSWSVSAVTDFVPDVNTLAATADALYALDASGALYKSNDGRSWSSTGASGWYSVIGGFGSTLLGVKYDGTTYSAATYPVIAAAEATALPDGFPVKGQSQTIEFTTEWSQNPQTIFVGGRTADGSLSSSAWGFDGTEWVRFSNLPDNAALEGVALVPYYTFTVKTSNWTVKTYDTLLAIGGRGADGSQSRKVYISRDWGMNWHLADDLMMLPDDMPAPAFAQAIVADSTLGDNASTVAGWYQIPTLAPNRWWWTVENTIPASRAVAPITSWQCPYIYLFGGENEAGRLYDTVWRGVINRMTFKPLQ